ncbi:MULTISPECIES: hypothetical protein [Bacillaceae]|uniref:Uncharacterized protein n=1 Tax=Evansella alkalicola TaxID=745819 RepID=A0ABS6JXP5_9BACI|nr:MULTISPECIES: hypothetical protein [Bacillaceae]MBU9723358.1 hypothetical protein [Bacillus alkalicola]
MSFLKRLFGNPKVKEEVWEPVDYKKKLNDTMDADEDPQWIRDILMKYIEHEEKHRTNEEMVMLLVNWLEAENLPEAFLDEEFLIRVYNQDSKFITDFFQLQCSVIFNGSPTREMVKEYYGERVASMANEAVKAYLGLLCYMHNVLAHSEIRKNTKR